METNSGKNIVKRGTFLYGGMRRCGVEIVETNFRPGSGDHEDPPEIRDDVEGVFFEVWYESAGNHKFSAGGGWFESVAAAIKSAEASVADLRWE